MPNINKKEEHDNIQSNTKNSEKILYIICIFVAALIYLLHFIPIFSDTSYLWGTDQWRYLPQWFQIILSGTAIISFSSASRKILLNRLNNIITATNKIIKKLPYCIAVVLFIVISFTVLWLLRQRTHFLGDGYLRLRSVAQGGQFAPEEPFDTFIHSTLYMLMSKITKIEPAYVFGIVGIVCGIIFLFIVYKFSKIFTSNMEMRILTAGVFLLMGTVQLFFGYVENYTILALLVMTYLYFSYRAVYYGFPLFILSFLLSFAICTHPTGIVLLPSFIYLFILEFFRKKRIGYRIRMIFCNLTAAAIPMSFLFYIFYAGLGMGPIQYFQKGNHLLPISVGSETEAFPYGLFSLGHFIEMWNLYLLLVPFSFFIGAFFSSIKKFAEIF